MVFSSKFRASMLCLTLLIPVSGVGGTLSAEEINNVDQTLEEYRLAWLDDDRDKILATVSEEVQLFIPGKSGGKIQGKKAVSDWWFPEADVSYPIVENVISEQEIFHYKVLKIIKLIYKFLIGVTVLFMGLHQLMDFFSAKKR